MDYFLFLYYNFEKTASHVHDVLATDNTTFFIALRFVDYCFIKYIHDMGGQCKYNKYNSLSEYLKLHLLSEYLKHHPLNEYVKHIPLSEYD